MTLALPILPGKLEAWRRFCQELRQGRRDQQRALLRELGVHALRASLLRTANGEVALLGLEADEPDRLLLAMADSQHPFVQWLRRELREIHAVDLEGGTAGTEHELVLEWHAAGV